MTGRSGWTLGAALAVLVAATGIGRAETASVSVGAAYVAFDPARWKAESGRGGGTRFAPVGEAARELDAVELRADATTDLSCEDAAQEIFATGFYDSGSVQRRSWSIGGVAGERFTAHTGCRNATPRGEVVCVRHRETIYLLSSVNRGCEGRNLFSGIDPLQEIADGLRFAP